MTRSRLSGSAAATRKRLEEPLALALVGGEGEDLLELIDHEHDFRLPGATRSIASSRPREPGLEPFVQARTGSHRDPQERGLELVEGVCSREHLGDEASLRAAQGPAPDRRNQPRTDHGRLPAPARPDDGKEPGSGPALRQPLMRRRVSCSRPKKSSASASVNARRPL